jgi:hypothetical protein
MSQRAFKYFTIVAGGTPQPLVGTKLTAAVIPTDGPDTPTLLPVVDSSIFLNGDKVILDVPSSGIEERVRVFNVPDATHINVVQMRQSHASGIYVRLAEMVDSVYVQCLDGNTGAIFIGDRPTMVKATGVGVIKKLQLVAASAQPIDYSRPRSGVANTDDLGNYWVDGTTGDSYLPSIGQI